MSSPSTTTPSWVTRGCVLLFVCLWTIMMVQCFVGNVNATGINILQQSKMINKIKKGSASSSSGFVVSPLDSYGAAPYPEYAHHHLVWINGEKQSQQGIIDLVNSYLANGIPVGSVDLEAGWSNGINNFVPNPSKFPNLYQMVKQLHKMNVKVFCWATPLVNTDSPNYMDGYNRGYYLNGGRTIEWWKGRGSFIDYTNSDAVNWWHNQLNNVLILNKTDGEGIDGWKTDGTDPYLYELLPYIYGKQGQISESDYSSMYYNDYLAYTQKVRGLDNALLVSRATDSFLGAAFFRFAPRDVVFNGWVGNKYANYFGLKETVKNMFHSAWDNYVGFTTEIAGYSGMRASDKVLYIRWFQLAAFTSAMHNGGYDLHEPWLFNDVNVTALYRKFTQAHMEIVPYLYTSGISAYASGSSMIKPLNEHTILDPSIWTFYLGNDMIVTPIFDFPGEVNVFFPFGTWVDYFDHDASFGGGVVPKFNITFNYTLTLTDFPAFYRAGSIMPMNITTNHVNLFGYANRNAGYLTLAIHYPIVDEIQEKVIYSHGIKVTYLRKSSDNTMTIEISAPNGFRGEYADQNLKYLLDIRGLLPSHFEGYTVSQYSLESDKFMGMNKHQTANDFDHSKQTSFYHDEYPSFYSLRKPNGKHLKLKQQHLWIKIHDISKGVRVLIK